MPDYRKTKITHTKKKTSQKDKCDSLTILACVLPYCLQILIHECKT